MMIYSKASQRNVNNAVAKAKEVKPLVKPVAGTIGLFDVKGSEGEFYRVEFSKNAAGELVVTCGCKGNAKGAACYHAAACSHIFKKQVADRAVEKATYCSKCSFRFVTGADGLCEHCRCDAGQPVVKAPVNVNDSYEAKLAAIRQELFG